MLNRGYRERRRAMLTFHPTASKENKGELSPMWLAEADGMKAPNNNRQHYLRKNKTKQTIQKLLKVEQW